MNPKITKASADMYRDHDLLLTEGDLILVWDKVYMSTSKVAELFGSGYANFSNTYAKALTDAGVKRVAKGRNRYYCLSDVLEVLNTSIKEVKTIFAVCAERSKI